MKTLTTLLTGALLLASTATQARILRVNNVAVLATACADCHQSLPSAISAALDGDTIHLEPSDANYGDATITKRLVIIGAGYKLGPTAPNNPGLQVNSQSSRVNLLTLNNINSSGTALLGLHFVNAGGGLNISNTANIEVRRCIFESLGINFPNGTGVSVSNILIAENFIGSGGINEEIGTQTINGLTIRNNLITGALALVEAADVITNLSVLNNTFLYNGNHQMKNAEIARNVFYQGNITGTNNTIHDNISAVALAGGDASNAVVNMANVYNLTVGTDDSKYDILASSPYNENGASPRGAFSGASPYRLSGIPPIPAIYQLQSTVETTPGGGPVQVTLSTRSNP